ncbi:MAG TPA: hypothetical protein VNE21_08625 [Mycobacteriales bacterium]|nr:hypothetical protein [Mycobacteriales bacterium]
MSIAGSWQISMNTPMGTQTAQLVFQTEGTSLTGTMTSPLGAVDISDGVADGDTATWKAAVTSPMPLTLEFSARVDGDAISGEAKLGAFGTSTFSGTRS